MIGLPTGVPIYLCTEPVDFRNGFDGLTGIVTTAMNHKVTDGSLFLFVNRKHDRIKALWWETGGLTLWYRRLEQGTVELPKPDAQCNHISIDNVELAMWIGGVSLKSAKKRRKRMVGPSTASEPVEPAAVCSTSQSRDDKWFWCTVTFLLTS